MQKRSNLTMPVVFSDSDPVVGPVKGKKAQELMVYDVTYLHFHRYLEIGLCLEGTGFCMVEDREFPFRAGDVQIIFPYQKHLSRNTGPSPSRWYWANIDVAELLERGGITCQDQVSHWLHHEMGLWGILDNSQYPDICRSVTEIIHLLYLPQEELHPREHLAAAMMVLLLQLCQASRDLPKLKAELDGFPTEIGLALGAINRSLEEEKVPTVQELCRLCGMSEANFRRVFRKNLGVSPKAYITACCIHKAKRLLAYTELPVTEIAARVGYQDLSGFNRSFLAAAGLSPTAFRRQMR